MTKRQLTREITDLGFKASNLKARAELIKRLMLVKMRRLRELQTDEERRKELEKLQAFFGRKVCEPKTGDNEITESEEELEKMITFLENDYHDI